MYTCYKKCYCQNKYNQKTIETLCSNLGTKAEYTTLPKNCCDNEENNCGCGFNDAVDTFPENPMLAQSYVPKQDMDKVFTPYCGLKMGTIFPELVSPYTPGQSLLENQYLRMTNKVGEGCNKW